MARQPAGRRGNRVYLYIVLGICVVALLGWGGSQSARVAGAAAIGSVDGLDLSGQAYANAIRSQLQRLSEDAGAPVTLEQTPGLSSQVLANLVADRALDAEAARLGLSVGDARVAAQIRGFQAFQGADGQFDRATYREQLSRNGLDPAEFEAGLRDDATRGLLQAAVVGGVPEPRALGDALATYANERRDVTWAAVTTDAVADQLQPATEDELRAFHEANPDRFTAPEVRRVGYAWLTPEALQASLPVEDDAVRALYDERRDQFVQEERRLVERLVFPDEAAADAARARLDGGEGTFEELVAGRGLALGDVDLGDVSRGDLGAAADPVFAAAVGDVVGPLTSDLGPALFRVNAVLAADETTFEEAAPQLRAELQNDAARRAIADVAPTVSDLLAGGATVTDIADQTELEAGTLDWSEGVTEGPAAYGEVRDAVAAAEAGGFPEVVELADGGLAVVQVDGVTPPALRPFEEARADVEAAWREDRLADLALAEATADAVAIAAGSTFEAEGLAPRAEAGLTRRSFVEGAPEGFTPAVFGMGAGEVQALPAPEGAVVVRLDAAAGPAPDDPDVAAEADAIAAQARDAIAADLYAAYARQLQAEAEVRIDDAAVAAIDGQF